MWNARMDEAQVKVKIAGKNINNLRYADMQMTPPLCLKAKNN